MDLPDIFAKAEGAKAEGTPWSCMEAAGRSPNDRHVDEVGIILCLGGIVGMGETRRQRAGLLKRLANWNPHPESVPINLWDQVPGSPLHGLPELEPLELVRTIAAAQS